MRGWSATSWIAINASSAIATSTDVSVAVMVMVGVGAGDGGAVTVGGSSIVTKSFLNGSLANWVDFQSWLAMLS